jgi:hypothetical protein
VIGPIVIAPAWLAIYAVLSMVGRYNEDYRPDKVLDGPAGARFWLSGLVIIILGIIAVAHLPDAWLSHVFGARD